GPGSISAFGLVTLTAPSAGSSGLPNDAAFAADAAVTNTPAAPEASRLRREKLKSVFMNISVSLVCALRSPTSLIATKKWRALRALPRRAGAQDVSAQCHNRTAL